MRILNFSDGFSTGDNPQTGVIKATNLHSLADNAAFVVVKGSAASAGDIYFNTTSNKVRFHNGDEWVEALEQDLNGNVTIENDLIVNGTTVTVNATTLEVADKNIVLNNGGSDATAEDAGLTVNRDSVQGSLIFDSSKASKWKAGLEGSENELIDDSSTQTITNKVIDADNNTISNISNTEISSSAGIEFSKFETLTAEKMVVTNPSGEITTLSTTAIEAGYLSGVTSAIQTQLDDKASASTVSSHNAATSGVHGVTGSVVGTNDAQVITNKDIDGGTASNTSRVTVPKADRTALDALTRKEGTVVYETSSKKLLFDNGTVLQAVGTGSGGVNLISDGDAESSLILTGYTSSSVGTRPAGTQSAGAAALTLSQTSSSPLTGTQSFLITKAASNAQGQNASVPFTVDPAYRAKSVSISFDYIINSGTFQAGSNFGTIQDSDVIVYIYDVTNSSYIEPSNFRFLSNSTTMADKFQATFQTSASGSSYRLILHVATASASAFSLKMDNISVGPSAYSIGGGPLEQILAYQTTVNSATANVDTLVALSTVVGSLYTYTLSSNAVRVKSSGKYKVRTKLEMQGNAETVTLKVGVNGVKTSGRAHLMDNNASASNSHFSDVFYFDLVAGDLIDMYVNIATNTRNYRAAELEIIQQRSPDLQLSNETDTRVVDMAYFKNAGVVGAGANYGSWTLGADTHGAFNTTTGNYTIPVSGDYDFEAGVSCNLAAVQLYIIKNGSATHRSAISANGTVGFSGTLKNLLAGDVIALYNGTGSSLTVSANSTDTYFSLKRISGPSAIAATALTAISYSSTNGPAVGTSATAIAFNVKDYDTHGNQYVGSTFTALAAGKYRVSARYLTTSLTLTTAQNINIFIYKNGAMYSGQQQYGNGATNISYTAQLMDTIQLNAGDTIQIYGQSSVATSVSTAAGFSRVCIERIGL